MMKDVFMPLTAVLSLALALAVGGCGGPPEAAAPARLFDDGAAEVGKRQLCDIYRQAVAVSPETGWRRTVTVPEGARLDVAFAVACGEGDDCVVGGRFVLEARRGSSPAEVLVDRKVRPRQRCWQVERVDLARFGGERLELALSAEVDAADPATAAPAALWAEPLWVENPPGGRPNIVLISVDTLRADHLGSYGYDRPTSPELDALAADGTRFSAAISQAPWTTPAQMSLLTSLYPTAHGVNQTFDNLKASLQGESVYRVLPQGVPTLATALKREGYRTAAITGGYTVAGDLGFHHGFDTYYDRGQHYLRKPIWTRLERWLDHRRGSPFFLFFHTFEVHTPYTRLTMADGLFTDTQIEELGEIFAGRRGGEGTMWERIRRYLRAQGLYEPHIVSALYDGGIRHTDAFLGRLFEALEDRGLYDRTILVVTSDHGEGFGEHSGKLAQHGDSMYEELIRVPLILRLPDHPERGQVIDRPVELIDVAPTLLEAAGVPVPGGMQGRSLLPLLTGERRAGDRWAISEATSHGPELKALRGQRYKYIAAFRPDGHERGGLRGAPVWEQLFDLGADPGERQNLYHRDPEQVRAMRRRMGQWSEAARAGAVDAETVEVSDQIRDGLRALGYLD